ncbi:hypothetical protein SRHO_G00140430 [Serrasalmus rhombeus]
MMIRLQRYSLTVTYTPGKRMYTADTLSRAVDPKEPVSSNTNDDVNAYLDMIGSKIVIPKSLRHDMLKKIHAGHLGIEKCRKRAREVMYWPRINHDIANEVSDCSTCQRYQSSNPAEPLKPHTVPNRPYQKVGADLFECAGKVYIVVTDYYSLYPEVSRLNTITAEAVITAMKAIFARHGVPSEVFSDNGPQFSSECFTRFAEEWNFVHTTSSLHYPQSNGLLEKSVQTVKRLLYKAKDSGTDYYQSLLVYRTMPLECGMSPARLLMGRRLRSNLPIQEKLLKTKEGEKVKRYKEQQKAKQKFYYDRGTQNLPELHTGDKVRLKDKANTWSQKATVLKEIQPRSYNIQTEDGTVLRRNRRDILGPAKADQQSDEAAEQHQHPENPSFEATVLDPSPDPDPSPGRSLKRSSRTIRPPERLIEQI